MTHPQPFNNGQQQASTPGAQQGRRSEAEQARIVIVGAGIAGLHAALTLQDVGLSCRVYEASNRIGGRMHSDTTFWAHGMVSEWCCERGGTRCPGNLARLWPKIKRKGNY
jgi:monoamine oxidase